MPKCVNNAFRRKDAIFISPLRVDSRAVPNGAERCRDVNPMLSFNNAHKSRKKEPFFSTTSQKLNFSLTKKALNLTLFDFFKSVLILNKSRQVENLHCVLIFQKTNAKKITGLLDGFYLVIRDWMTSEGKNVTCNVCPHVIIP